MKRAINRVIPGRTFLRRAAIVTLIGAIAVIAGACGGEGHAPDKTDTRPVVPVQLASVAEEEWAAGSEVTAGVLPLSRATPGTVLMGRVDRVKNRDQYSRALAIYLHADRNVKRCKSILDGIQRYKTLRNTRVVLKGRYDTSDVDGMWLQDFMKKYNLTEKDLAVGE